MPPWPRYRDAPDYEGSGHGQVQGQAAWLVHRHPSCQHVMGPRQHHVTLSSTWGGRHEHCPVTDGETEAPTCLAMLGLELPSGLFRMKMKAPGRTPHPRAREVKGRQERLFCTKRAQQMSRNQRPVQALPWAAPEGSPWFCGSPASKRPHCCSPEAAEPAPCPSCPQHPSCPFWLDVGGGQDGRMQ